MIQSISCRQSHLEYLESNLFLNISEEALNQTDFHSKKILKSIQETQHAQSSDFYVCYVEQKGKKYFFEGYKFLEAFEASKDLNEGFFNPWTNEPIVSFKIYKSTPQSPELFELYNEESSKHPFHYLTVLSCNPDFPESTRKVLHFNLGLCYLEKFQEDENESELLEKAIIYLKKAAESDHQNAQYQLAEILKEKNQIGESLSWRLRSWKKEDGSFPIDGLLDLALNCEETELFSIALLFLKKAAFLGVPYAIGKVIYYYSEGIGAQKNTNDAEMWRTQLPEKWSGISIETYLEHFAQEELDPAHFFPIESSFALNQESIVLPNHESIRHIAAFYHLVRSKVLSAYLFI